MCPSFTAANRIMNVLVERPSPAIKTGDLCPNDSEHCRFHPLRRYARLAPVENPLRAHPTARERPDSGDSDSKKESHMGNPSSSDGWTESAQAWLASIGDDGDYGRKFVLDAPMLARVKRRPFATALDVGCGEGRFCRMLQALGIATVGIDPTDALIERARVLDRAGDYRLARAETLDVADESFDLVVSYLSLIDIPDLATAASKMTRALRPGGTLLIANLASFNTAGMPEGWSAGHDGRRRFCIDRYLDERRVWVAWDGLRVANWHRPLSTYVTTFLERDLELRHFAEPAPNGGDPEVGKRYRRVPFFNITEWQKP
jgi:SAM-dependent methyltransferase